jgi:hypothetical protein
MRHAMVGIVLVGLTAGALAAAAETGTRYPCFRVTQEPRIDGDVAGDPAWQTVPAATGFRVLGGNTAQAKQTTIWLCWGPEALFVAAVCEEPHAASLKPTAKDGGWTWAEDSIEFFLVPAAGGQAYQFGVTASGAKGSGEGNPDITRCTAAARILADSYSVELRVPYAVVAAVTPRAGAVWRGTVCRNIQTVTPSGGDKFTCWSPLQSRFLEPDNFAHIDFLDRTLTAAEASRETEALNRPYREALTRQLATLAARVSDYRDALQSAVGDPHLGSKAQELLAAWQRIEEVNRQAGNAPLPDVRQALLAAGELLAASHQTKYTVLMERLFAEP